LAASLLSRRPVKGTAAVILLRLRLMTVLSYQRHPWTGTKSPATRAGPIGSMSPSQAIKEQSTRRQRWLFKKEQNAWTAGTRRPTAWECS
jgi:hypothetical protein